jgi:hypothetical protein
MATNSKRSWLFSTDDLVREFEEAYSRALRETKSVPAAKRLCAEWLPEARRLMSEEMLRRGNGGEETEETSLGARYIYDSKHIKKTWQRERKKALRYQQSAFTAPTELPVSEEKVRAIFASVMKEYLAAENGHKLVAIPPPHSPVQPLPEPPPPVLRPAPPWNMRYVTVALTEVKSGTYRVKVTAKMRKLLGSNRAYAAGKMPFVNATKLANFINEICWAIEYDGETKKE